MNKSTPLAPEQARGARAPITAARPKGAPRGKTVFNAKLRPKVPSSLNLLPEHCPDSAAQPVLFEYFNPNAREVFVAGSFNDWQPRASAFTKECGGKWLAEILLQPGCHEYRFVVDGQWENDPMAAQFVTNPFGGLNCVRNVRGKIPSSTDADSPPGDKVAP